MHDFGRERERVTTYTYYSSEVERLEARGGGGFTTYAYHVPEGGWPGPRNGAAVATYTYDASGLLVSVQDSAAGGCPDACCPEALSGPTYLLDGLGRLIGWVDGDGRTVRFGP